MKRLRMYAIAAAFLAAGSVSAADTYVLDTVHTQILFTVSHMGFSNSTGTFTDFDGKFVFDEDNFANSSVEVTIDTASINMNDDTWNEHMRDEKWFNVAEYPTMTFKSAKVEQTGDNTMDITGDLTLLGVTKPATLKTVFNKAGDLMGEMKAGFSAKTKLDRTAFGMKTFSPMIGDEVTIRIEVEGTKQ